MVTMRNLKQIRIAVSTVSLALLIGCGNGEFFFNKTLDTIVSGFAGEISESAIELISQNSRGDLTAESLPSLTLQTPGNATLALVGDEDVESFPIEWRSNRVIVASRASLLLPPLMDSTVVSIVPLLVTNGLVFTGEIARSELEARFDAMTTEEMSLSLVVSLTLKVESGTAPNITLPAGTLRILLRP